MVLITLPQISPHGQFQLIVQVSTLNLVLLVHSAVMAKQTEVKKAILEDRITSFIGPEDGKGGCDWK